MGYLLGIYVLGLINVDISEKEVIKVGGNLILYMCELDELFSYVGKFVIFFIWVLCINVMY